jgi:hypothetical protein
VARSIDQVENVVLSIFGVIVKANCLGLDGDASLFLQIHVIENLSGHLPLR